MEDSAQSIHARLCELARSQAALDRDIGQTLLEAYRRGVHVVLGYASFREYASRVFGWTERQAEERVRVALALEGLPGLSRSLASGSLCWSVARELTRIATPETEREWVHAAEAKTARQVEQLVSGRTLGARPDDAAPPDAERHRITLDVSASSYAMWQDARRVLTTELGASVDDDALVAALAQSTLAARASGERDQGRSTYQIALRVCERCSHAEQTAGSQSVTVEPPAAEAARCDAQLIGHGRTTQTIPPRVRREVMLRHAKRCAVPGCSHAVWVDLHHVTPRSEGGTHDPDGLVVLCGVHHRHVHEGRLVIRGSYGTGFVFEHADGSPYGAATASPQRAARFRTALGSLTSLGFRASEAQRMLDAASPHVGADASIEQIVTAALRRAEVGAACMVRERLAVYERICAAA